MHPVEFFLCFRIVEYFTLSLCTLKRIHLYQSFSALA
jgi:hypothetical protein